MEAAVAIRYGNDKRLSFRISPLHSAELVASHYGFYDVDIEPNGIGGLTVTASAPNRKVTAKGQSMAEAVEKLIEVLSG